MDDLNQLEIAILQNAADGFLYRDLAVALNMTVSTLKRFACGAFQKLGADNLTHAVAIAMRSGKIK